MSSVTSIGRMPIYSETYYLQIDIYTVIVASKDSLDTLVIYAVR